jgi:hypothetical protein
MKEGVKDLDMLLGRGLDRRRAPLLELSFVRALLGSGMCWIGSGIGQLRG